VMAMMHFLCGMHIGFIDKLNGTKKVAIDNWLKARRTNNSILLADNKVRRVVERMKALRLRQGQRHDDNFRNQAKGLQRY
jgi:hypothetical protein